MGDVAGGHDPVAVTQAGYAAAVAGAAIDTDIFADDIVAADLEPGRLAGVLLVLCIPAERCERVDPVARADTGRAVDHDMRADPRAAADHHLRPDYGVGADMDAVGYFRSSVNDCPRIDQVSISRSVHMISAEATTLPSTLASQSNTQMPRRVRSSRACSTSWSPGSTGCLNLTLSMPTRK